MTGSAPRLPGSFDAERRGIDEEINAIEDAGHPVQKG